MMTLKYSKFEILIFNFLHFPTHKSVPSIYVDEIFLLKLPVTLRFCTNHGMRCAVVNSSLTQENVLSTANQREYKQ